MANRVPAKTDVLQGTLDLMILQTLATLGPQHGYAIAVRLEQVSSGALQLNMGTLYPGLMVPVSMFLFQFMGIDHFLSNQFMRWPIKSPNYFHKVDRTIWLWNWSAPGKLLNSAVVTAVLVFTKSAILGSIVCGAILVLKVWTAVRMHQLKPPEANWT